jgi:hypothetical protein
MLLSTTLSNALERGPDLAGGPGRSESTWPLLTVESLLCKEGRLIAAVVNYCRGSVRCVYDSL